MLKSFGSQRVDCQGILVGLFDKLNFYMLRMPLNAIVTIKLKFCETHRENRWAISVDCNAQRPRRRCWRTQERWRTSRIAATWRNCVSKTWTFSRLARTVGTCPASSPSTWSRRFSRTLQSIKYFFSIKYNRDHLKHVLQTSRLLIERLYKPVFWRKLYNFCLT